MPNHITNILTIGADKDTVQKILQEIKTDQYGLGSIDFNKIILMPETLRIESGSRSRRGLELYQSYLKECAAAPEGSGEAIQEKYRKMTPDDPELFSLGRQCYENIRDYGFPDWYEWSIENWGTKWNSYGYEDLPSYEEGCASLRFQTAWSAPEPILHKLSEIYPEVTFFHRWADEDFGYNVGEREYRNGEVVSETFLDGGSVEAYETASDILQVELNSEESGYYLSADESGYFYLDPNETYELIELFDQPALFSSNRITSDEIPKGLYSYDLRKDDDGNSFSAIEPYISKNHAGSVITNEPVDFGEAGHIAFTEETSPNFLGCQITLPQFMNGDFEQTQEQMGGMEL